MLQKTNSKYINKITKKLITALEKDNLENAEMLLRIGAEPNLCLELRNYSKMIGYLRVESALDLVVSVKKNLPALKLLHFFKADLNPTPQFRYTPLMRACEFVCDKQHEIIEYLVENGANVNACHESNNERPLYILIHMFSLSNNSEYVRLAVKNLESVKCLLENGASIDKELNDGFMLLHEAAINLNYDLVEFLLNQNVDVNRAAKKEDFWNEGETPLMAVVQSFILEADETTNLIVEKIIKLLLARGADKLLKNKDGETALDLAISSKNKKAIMVLSE